jgi:hypothetical protein
MDPVWAARGREGSTVARSLDDMVLVERHLFGLMDLDVAGCPKPWPTGPMPPVLTVWAQVNRVDVRSVGEDHVAAVRLECWDSAPTAPDGDWDDHEEVRLPLTSGEIRLWALTDGPSPQAFRAGPPGHIYAVHVWVGGRGKVLDLQHEGKEIPDGTEQYVLQFHALQPWSPYES